MNVVLTIEVTLQLMAFVVKGKMALERWHCFSKNSHCDLDLGPRTLKLELVQDIVILNICVK